ncbi:MAG TPA: hypothetical protein ENH29_02775, partial [Bacteroidetes bacterium]|nr:hypothetical protein [Bacteroidota bacterium]
PEHSLLLDQHDVSHDRFLREMQKHRIEVIVPMIAGGKELGFIAYGKKFNGETYSQEDIDFLESLANLAAIAVDKSLLFKEIQSTNKKLDKKVQELNTLFEISRELNSSLDQAKISQILSFAIMGEFLINKCVVLIKGNETFRVEIAKGITVSRETVSLCINSLPLQQLFRDEKFYYFLDDEIPEDSFNKTCKNLIDNGIKYLIPMFSKNDIKGVIGIGSKITGEKVARSELSFLQTLGNDAMIAIENARMVQEMLEKQRMEDELQIAREIQAKLLPDRFPDISGFEIAAKNISSYQVGGDYYDCIQLNEHLFGIAIADVSGKSTPAALLVSSLQASLRALANEKAEIVAMVEHINQIICQNTTVDKFITFFYCILDVQAMTITYVNAGHNPPYLIRNDGSLHLLQKGGLILGLFPTAQYESETILMRKGEVIFMFTDGVTEAMNENEEEFEETRLETLLSQTHLQPAKALLNAVSDEVAAFVGDIPQSDDITMVVIRAQ